MHGSISIKTYRFLEIVILIQQNAKSVTDASIWVMFISKYSDMLDQSSLPNSTMSGWLSR